MSSSPAPAEPAAAPRRARWLALGTLPVVAAVLVGIIAIGGEWFQMWRSTAWNGEDAALRSSILALFALAFVYLPSRSWTTSDEPHERAPV